MEKNEIKRRKRESNETMRNRDRERQKKGRKQTSEVRKRTFQEIATISQRIAMH